MKAETLEQVETELLLLLKDGTNEDVRLRAAGLLLQMETQSQYIPGLHTATGVTAWQEAQEMLAKEAAGNS